MFSSNTSQVADGGYQISRSLRFNSADSAYLNRTPASAGNRKTWTVSCWVKRGEIGTRQGIFGNPDASGLSGVYCEFISDVIQFGEYSTSGWNWVFNTSAVYRDPSAWYHFVFAVDTTQATASNRVKIYVNGVQVTSFSTASYPSQNSDTFWNNTQAAAIGRLGLYNGFYFGGYITEIYNIDGQALTPSSFGETNAQTGVWQPKAYSGSYGTNGFYLNFSDNSNTTAATLGKDYSGNGNNWTPNNFSVAAGAGNDSLVDSPTAYGTDTGVGGSVRGNYVTLNALVGTGTLANGNLDFTSSGQAFRTATIGLNSGKWYWEVYIGSTPANTWVGMYINQNSLFAGYVIIGTGNMQFSNAGGTFSVIDSTFQVGDTFGIAADFDAGTVTWYRNGSVAVTLTGATLNTDLWYPGCHVNAAASSPLVFNFGQRPFAYTAPSGFKALCTQNLPTPTIGATTATQAANYFNPVIYAGDSTSNRTITTGLQSDFVWIKNRTSTGPTHILFDVIRGAGRTLYSSSTIAEVNNGGFYVQQFNSTNFLLGSPDNASNATGENYVSWVWRANGSGVTNTAGSITSTVSANTTSGFSIVTYTGTNANATVGHGLGVAPAMIIAKARGDTSQWSVYHRSLGKDAAMFLNLTAPSGTYSNYWGTANPTSTVFGLGTPSYDNNQTTTYVAYCFAEVPGYSAFGSYTGNGSSAGPFVFTGFKPAFVLIKRTDDIQNWFLMDNKRNPANAVDNYLMANSSDAAANFVPSQIDFLSNGFKLLGTAAGLNASGGSYIYMAVAENPFKYSLAR